MSRPLAIAPSPVAGIVACLAAAISFGAPAVALANGAFPESYQIVVPADRPQQIILATNFGLIISDDGGASWNWTCEQKQTTNASLYGVSAPPLDRLFAASGVSGLAYSDDGSCTWTSSGGSLDTALATDYFADPTDPMHVLALAAAPADLTVPTEVFSSTDGGKTFGAALFTAPAGVALTSLESARTDPNTIYVAGYQIMGYHPLLERTTDGGAHWTALDVEPSLGANTFRIVAVDPDDAGVIFVRVIATTGDLLAVSRDGGQTFTTVITTTGQLTGYARLASGTLLVTGAVGTEGVGFRSTDDGATFEPWTPRTTNDAGVLDVGDDGGVPRAPHVRALAVRGDKLYGAAKNFSDDWALGVSTDEGVTFERIMAYDQVQSIRACAQMTCRDSCTYQAGQQIWADDVCGPRSMAEAPVEPPEPATGCGCRVGGALGPAGVAALGVALALARRRGARPSARRRRARRR